MFKLKKRPVKKDKPPVLYNVLENYTDHDPPGNVMVCAMTEPENLPLHAQVLSESYGIPCEAMESLLKDGGVYVFPQEGLLVTKGAFVAKVDPNGQQPKQTWLLDLEQFAAAERMRTGYGVSLEEATERVFYRGLPQELQDRLKKPNLGLDYSKLERSVAAGGDLTYIDFRKDWSPHFKRKCVMPDGQLIETSGLQDFAELHDISVEDARNLLDHGGTLELRDRGVLACQIINGQPSVARFNARQYGKAKALQQEKDLHMLDALSEVAYKDPVLMRALRRAETPS
ncbi:MAG: hypothetical protein AB7P17_06285 [Nitrospirales bacterium]|nr:hypothetical protein [Nitrospirales bacterium]